MFNTLLYALVSVLISIGGIERDSVNLHYGYDNTQAIEVNNITQVWQSNDYLLPALYTAFEFNDASLILCAQHVNEPGLTLPQCWEVSPEGIVYIDF